MIYSAHKGKNTISGAPKSDGHGQKIKHRILTDIKSPFQKSVRTSKKEYPDPNLNITKTYDLFQQMCTRELQFCQDIVKFSLKDLISIS